MMNESELVKPIDAWFESQDDDHRECFFFLRQLMRECDPRLTETWKYKMPIYCINGKMCCYIWKDKKSSWPYVGFIPGKKMNHPKLQQGNRKMMKVFHIDPSKDVPVATLKKLIREAVGWTTGSGKDVD